MPKKDSQPSVVDGKKFCLDCETWKPVADFYEMKRKNRPNSTYYPVCEECKPARQAKNHKNRAEKEPEYWRPAALRSTLGRHGLTVEDWDRMMADQEGKCAICGKVPGATMGVDKNRLVIDHSHTTGKVRALLCDFCNRGIGMFFDDPELLVAAAEYCKRFEEVV